MAKQKKKRSKKKIKYLKIANHKIRRSYVVIAASVIVVVLGIIFWRNSYLWPWPSQEEIDQRLSEVVDGCLYNENSRACKSMTGKYNMQFEYCHSYADIPEIDKPIPVYGVAKLKDFSPSSLNYIPPTLAQETGTAPGLPAAAPQVRVVDEGRGTRGDDIYPYYGCVDSLDLVDKASGANLISNPQTLALYRLSNIPQFSFSGCTLKIPSRNASLWSDIPNYASIINEGENLINVYNKCSMAPDIRSAADKINSKLNSYANNYQVQLFYRGFDEWNTTGAQCVFNADDPITRKFYDQRCGMGDKKTGSDETWKDTVRDFADEMRTNMSSLYFTSKTVITN